MKQEEPFRPRTMSISELAQLYYPYITAKTASQNFRKWLNSDEKLMSNLKELAYDGSGSFTPRQVALIIERFGEP